MTDTFDSLEQEAIDFRDAREWAQFHRPKDLVLALQVEVAELAELFLWKSPEDIEVLLSNPEAKRRLEEEIADVQIFLFYLARAAKISIPSAVRRKLELNAKRYPVETARGSAEKYRDS